MSIFTHFRKKGLTNTKIEDAFQAFAEEVIHEAKQNLQRAGKGGGALESSLEYKLEVATQGTVSLDFIAEQYADYIDKGVKGSKSSLRAPKSPYAYTTKMPPRGILDRWVVGKGLRGSRDKKGRFIKRKSMVYLIQRSIFERGIKTTPFFTNAFDAAFQNIDQEILDAFALDVENLLVKESD